MKNLNLTALEADIIMDGLLDAIYKADRDIADIDQRIARVKRAGDDTDHLEFLKKQKLDRKAAGYAVFDKIKALGLSIL